MNPSDANTFPDLVYRPKSMSGPGEHEANNLNENLAGGKRHQPAQLTTSTPTYPLTVRFTNDQHERMTFIVLKKADGVASSMGLGEAQTLESFRKGIADRLGLDVESLPRIHVSMYETSFSMWVDTWQDYFSMLLELKNWDGWTAAGGKLVCQIVVTVEPLGEGSTD